MSRKALIGKSIGKPRLLAVRFPRRPVSVILDCLAAGMTAEEITAEYPSVTVAGIRAAAGYGAALAREELLPIPQSQ